MISRFSLESFGTKTKLLPNQTILLHPNIDGAILFTNNGSEKGVYLITFEGLNTTGAVISNEIKLVTYSSAQSGTLKNTSMATLLVSIN